MVSFQDQSWNIRDSHMVETLQSLMKFHGRQAKGIVWEHNTHVGDARYTRMKDEGMWNVGQLVREKYEKDGGVFIVGFSSYQGSVIAGSEWGSTMQHMTVPPAADGSIEYILHEESSEDRLILFENEYWKNYAKNYVGQRAIGVVYKPEYEIRNYVPTILPSRYDALIYIDTSKALHPLHLKPDGTQIPETYPFGF
jgi:erythromycin esterase